MMSILDPIRRVKHFLWVNKLEASRAFDNRFNALYDKVFPYRFDPTRYPLSFVSLRRPVTMQVPSSVPKRIFLAWTGDNPLTPNREKALQSIQAVQGELDVVLVTPQNLDQWILPGHPLPKAYAHLSAVHRSDYLRAYLLFHHGGGYSDIKVHHHPWHGAFTQLEATSDAWVLGYSVPTVREATAIDGPIGHDVHRHYKSLIGFGAFIAKANNPLMAEWLEEAERRLAYYSKLLREFPGDVWGQNEGYPVPWTALGSQIFEPLGLKYLPHLLINDQIKPQLDGHR